MTKRFVLPALMLACFILFPVVNAGAQTANEFYNRGLAYYNKGNYDQAIADYTKAIQIYPNYADAYENRDWTYLYLNKGDTAFEQATAFLELNGLKGDSAPYAVLVGYIGLRKSNKAAAAKVFLETWIKQVEPEAWTTKIMRYMHGDLTAAGLLALAVDNGKLTEAHTYIGEMQLFAGTPATAKIHFGWVKENGTKTFSEYTLAIAELNRMANSSKPK